MKCVIKQEYKLPISECLAFCRPYRALFEDLGVSSKKAYGATKNILVASYLVKAGDWRRDGNLFQRAAGRAGELVFAKGLSKSSRKDLIQLVDEVNSDVAVLENFISITPIQFDLTDYRIIKNLREWGIELP